MFKDTKMNAKRILALFLTASLVMPFNYAVKAETNDNSGIISAADKIERNDDAYGETTFIQDSSTQGLKLKKYIAKKYSDLDTNNDGICEIAEMRANETHTTIEINGNDFPEISKNMVQFKYLSNLANVDTIVIDGVDEIRNFYLPVTTKNLTIKNTTLNLYSDGILLGIDGDDYSKTFSYFNFNKLVIDNVIIGNRYETVGLDAEEVNSAGTPDPDYAYAKNNITLNISNCSNLSEFVINVGFESDNSGLTFNAGETLFSNLTKEKSSVTKSTSNGRISVASSNDESFFRKNGDAVTSVSFYNEYFKNFLIQKINLDTDSNGVLTREELNAVKNLTINRETVGSQNMDVIHDFRDLQYLSNLESLTIELGRGTNVAYIENISFPDTGKLKKVTISNTITKLDSMILPGLEEFIYKDNSGIVVNNISTIPSIKINDTAGRLNSVTVDNSGISRLELSNGSNENKKLTSINVGNCPDLNTVEFTGSGYTLPGNAGFTNCVNLKAVGKKTSSDANAPWQIDGDFAEGSLAVLDISNCSNFGTISSNIYLNYNFAEGKTLSVYAYGLNNLSEEHKITTSRSESAKGSVKIYCGDGDNWIKNTYGENEGHVPKVAGHSVVLGSSAPNIALFPCGNELLNAKDACKYNCNNCTTKSHQWVKRWDIVLRMKDTINNFNNLSYYVAENDENGEETLRRVYYNGPKYFVIDHPEIVSINSTNGTLETLKKGHANIKVYMGGEGETPSSDSYLGEVNVYVRSIATGISLVNNNQGLGTGTENDPIIVERGKGKLSFSATTSYDNENGVEYLLKDKSGNEIPDEVYWIFADYVDGNYSDMICSDAYPESTDAGISLVEGSDTWNGRTNTREFTFSKNNKFRITAQVHVNKTGNDANGSLIKQDLYIDVVDPKTNNDSVTQTGGSTSAQSSSPSQKSTESTQTLLSYVAPGKQTVAKSVVMNPNGTSTIVELHSDGTVGYKTYLQKTATESVNMALSSNMNPLAPTAVYGISVIVERSGTQPTSRITKVTAEVDALTVNGNINVSPQLVSSLKNIVAGELGKNAPGTIDIKLNTLAADGKALSIIIDSGSLKNNGVMKAYAIDPLTGNYIMIDLPTLKYDKRSGLNISGLISGFEYRIVSSKNTKKIENRILNSVKLSDQFSKPVQVIPGAVLDMSKALSTELNICNVQKFEYSVSGNKAVINPATGLLAINADATPGTVTVGIKVTLKNGKTKTIKAKVKIQ